jgi:hypothetical protein
MPRRRFRRPSSTLDASSRRMPSTSTSVLSEVAHQAAEATARIVPAPQCDDVPTRGLRYCDLAIWLIPVGGLSAGRGGGCDGW